MRKILIRNSAKRIMKFSMFTIIRKQLQIFRSIILFIFNTINRVFSSFVMHYFSWFKIAANHFFHNKMRPINITIFRVKGMSRAFNKNIPSRILNNTAFPIITFFHSLRKTNIFTMFKSKLFSLSCFAKIFSPFPRKWWTFLTKMGKTNIFLPFLRFNFTFRNFASPNITTFTRTAFSSLKFRQMSFKSIFTNNTFFKHCVFSLIFIIAFNIISCQVNLYAADQWAKGQPASSASPSDIPTLIQTNNEALDRFLSYGRHDCRISYSSASAVSVAAGSIVCSNSAGTTRQLRVNTSATSVTFADLDNGGEVASTTYYIFAIADTDATTFTCKISTSSTAPSVGTYYKRLGSFYNDDSSNITQITNDDSTNILVSTGTIVSGGTIPLPTGYVEAQCTWWVWIETTSTAGGVNGEIRHWKTTISGRVPTFKLWRWNTESYQDMAADGYGRYVIIGAK